jgi:hypothetical protein
MEAQDMSQSAVDFAQLVRDWIKEVGNDRSTMVAGLAALDTLVEKCPVTEEDIFSKRGSGEVRKARGSSMRALLSKYGQPTNYLSDGATTRSAAPKTRRLLEIIDYGRPLVSLNAAQRAKVIQSMIQVVVLEIEGFFRRQRIKVALDRQDSPQTWVKGILTLARAKSGGKVEQHLVGAKLQKRHPEVEVSAFAASAGDVQTGRPGDFIIGSSAYHVTTAPSLALIQKCKENLSAGKHPVLIVPRDKIGVASSHAEAEGIEGRLSIIGIEDFLALNIIELSVGDQARFIETLRDILQEYNRRIEAVETDQSMKIDLP